MKMPLLKPHNSQQPFRLSVDKNSKKTVGGVDDKPFTSPPTCANTFNGIRLGSSITLTTDETARSAGVGPPWKSSTASR